MSCSGRTALCLAITRAAQSRPHQRDLRHTLVSLATYYLKLCVNGKQDMIGAYANFTSASCAKCNRRIDAQAMPPVVRRSKSYLDVAVELQDDWVALHEACLS